MGFSDIIIWFFVIVTFYGNPILGSVFLILVLVLYANQSKNNKVAKEDKKHEDIVEAIRNRKEDK
jgi:DNA-binding FadR family transcriptional regulator